MFADCRRLVALFNKDAWKNTVYDPSHPDTIYSSGESCGLASCTSYEGNKELQAAMTQTREEEGKSGFKHRHEWYQGTKNY